MENIRRQQDAIFILFKPLFDEMLETVSERVLAATNRKEPKYYTRKETAQLLHITLPTLSRLTKDGLLEAKRIGSRILYEAEAIDEAVKKQVIFRYRRG